MKSKSIEKKIDEAAKTTKRALAKVDETRQTATELAGAAIASAQSTLTQASKKGEHRSTETVTKAAHRAQETVTSSQIAPKSGPTKWLVAVTGTSRLAPKR